MAHDSRGSSPAIPLWRFTLRQFFIGIALIALSCVALRGASSWWVSAMLGLTLFVLTTSLLLVAYRRGAERAYWAGFAIFGWVYVLMLILGWTMVGGPLRTSGLFTDKLSRVSYDWLYAQATTPAMTGSSSGSYGYGGYGSVGGSSDSSGMASGMEGGDMSGEGAYGSSMPGVAGSPGAPPGYGGPIGQPPPPAYKPPSKDHFTNVAHGVWALLLAACGGWLARLIYVTQPRDSPVAST
jgi:hypothetical protein